MNHKCSKKEELSANLTIRFCPFCGEQLYKNLACIKSYSDDECYFKEGEEYVWDIQDEFWCYVKDDNGDTGVFSYKELFDYFKRIEW